MGFICPFAHVHARRVLTASLPFIRVDPHIADDVYRRAAGTRDPYANIRFRQVLAFVFKTGSSRGNPDWESARKMSVERSLTRIRSLCTRRQWYEPT
jgi:hypothetical protein